MTHRPTIATLALALALALPGTPGAAADGAMILAQQQRNCSYQGRSFPPGARLGHLVCRNGRWVPG